MFQVGDTIKDLELVSRLSAGGMATLFLGRRRGAAGFVHHAAVKVVHPHLAEDADFTAMFLDEARLLSHIEHPNVVRVEDFGEVGGCYFMVMEYVSGCTLADLLRSLAKQQRRMMPELAVQIAIQVADGLHAAHEATDGAGTSLELVHRDVSPQNVLLGYKGHVKLIDFGIAKARGRRHETSSQLLKGKLRYMSPEQAYGRPLDRRTDLYALGVVLWEMLTMHRLFRAGSDLALLEVVRHPEVVPPGRIVAGLPPALDAAVMAALAPDCEARVPTAQELRRLLAEAVPAALALDATDLSRFLGSVMSDAIDPERSLSPPAGIGTSSIPESPSRPPATVGTTADDGGHPAAGLEAVLDSMTVVTYDILLDDPAEGSREVSGPAPARSARVRMLWWTALALGLLVAGALAGVGWQASRGSRPHAARVDPAAVRPVVVTGPREQAPVQPAGNVPGTAMDRTAPTTARHPADAGSAGAGPLVLHPPVGAPPVRPASVRRVDSGVTTVHTSSGPVPIVHRPPF